MIFSFISFVYMFLYLYLGHDLKNRLKLSVTAPCILWVCSSVSNFGKRITHTCCNTRLHWEQSDTAKWSVNTKGVACTDTWNFTAWNNGELCVLYRSGMINKEQLLPVAEWKAAHCLDVQVCCNWHHQSCRKVSSENFKTWDCLIKYRNCGFLSIQMNLFPTYCTDYGLQSKNFLHLLCRQVLFYTKVMLLKNMALTEHKISI
jgi:hypothetical protein